MWKKTIPNHYQENFLDVSIQEPSAEFYLLQRDFNAYLSMLQNVLTVRMCHVHWFSIPNSKTLSLFVNKSKTVIRRLVSYYIMFATVQIAYIGNMSYVAWDQVTRKTIFLQEYLPIQFGPEDSTRVLADRDQKMGLFFGRSCSLKYSPALLTFCKVLKT